MGTAKSIALAIGQSLKYEERRIESPVILTVRKGDTSEIVVMHDDQVNKFFLHDIENDLALKYIMKGPSWYNINIRGCCHPAGVILTGTTGDDVYGAREIVLVTFDDRTIIELPDLECSVANVGMVYDAHTDVLTIAGGRNNNNGQWQTTSNVFQLRNLKTIIERAQRHRYWAKERNMIALKDFSVWDKLEDLPSAVSDPVLVNDDEYLYVLGGNGSLQCARIRKGQRTGWQIICDLPHPCDGENHGGAFYINQTVTLVSVSHIMELQNTGHQLSWRFTKFQDDTIIQCIPMLYGGEIFAVLKRNDIYSIESYKNANRTWNTLFVNTFRATNGFPASIGAAMIQVFKFNNTQ